MRRFWNGYSERETMQTGVVPRVDGSPQATHAVFVTKPTRRGAGDAVKNASGGLRDGLDRLDVVEIAESGVFKKPPK